jgi:hypothetical protein
MINRKIFTDTLRKSIFSTGYTVNQIGGIDAILTKWEASGLTDLRWLAYMMATAYHETARTMQPVRETLAANDNQAIAILERSFARGSMPWVKSPYWRLDADGKSWLGRGLVQLTFKANYEKLAALIGVDIVKTPALAMNMDVALDILFEGMTKGASNRGDFTGVSLEDFFNDKVSDWTNARKIINGLESAGVIAGYGQTIYAALKLAA